MIAGPVRQAPRIVAFFDELKGLGFVEGHNLQIVAGGFGLREDQFSEVAATVVKSAPEFAVSQGMTTPPTLTPGVVLRYCAPQGLQTMCEQAGQRHAVSAALTT